MLDMALWSGYSGCLQWEGKKLAFVQCLLHAWYFARVRSFNIKHLRQSQPHFAEEETEASPEGTHPVPTASTFQS